MIYSCQTGVSLKRNRFSQEDWSEVYGLRLIISCCNGAGILQAVGNQQLNAGRLSGLDARSHNIGVVVWCSCLRPTVPNCLSSPHRGVSHDIPNNHQCCVLIPRKKPTRNSKMSTLLQIIYPFDGYSLQSFVGLSSS
jgi:hypothetical protein